MAEYELEHGIKNLCRNNQVRGVCFEEVECGDPFRRDREGSCCGRQPDPEINNYSHLSNGPKL